jgi:hypothetical protein
LERLPERGDVGLRIQIVFRERHQHADPPHLRRLTPAVTKKRSM